MRSPVPCLVADEALIAREAVDLIDAGSDRKPTQARANSSLGWQVFEMPPKAWDARARQWARSQRLAGDRTVGALPASLSPQRSDRALQLQGRRADPSARRYLSLTQTASSGCDSGRVIANSARAASTVSWMKKTLRKPVISKMRSSCGC